VSGDNSRHVRPPSSARSGQSQTQNGQRRTDSFGVVDEYHTLEDTMKPPRQRTRNSGSSGGHLSNGGGSNRFRKTLPTPTVVRLVDDDIVDSGDVLASSHSNPIKNSNSKVEVQIPAPPRPAYQGTSNRDASRPKRSLWLNGNSKEASESSDTSRYFPRQNGHQASNPSNSRSVNGSAAERNSGHETRQSDRTFGSRKGSDATTQNLEDKSFDELSVEHLDQTSRTHRQIADELLAAVRRPKKLSAALRGNNSRQTSINLDDSSDEEPRNKKADMHHTDFGSSKKVKQSKPRGEGRFDVLQVYSPSQKWLVSGQKVTWSLHENCKDSLFSFFDDQGIAVPGLELNPKAISKLIRANNYPKIIIHKSVDLTANRSPWICVEFSERDEAATLVERIKKFYPEVGVVPKPR
jgi:hypothetical protein